MSDWGNVEISATVMGATVMASIIGTDDQGRTIIICPVHHDEAYVEPDGRVVCPMQDAMNAFLADAMAKMQEAELGKAC